MGDLPGWIAAVATVIILGLDIADRVRKHRDKRDE